MKKKLQSSEPALPDLRLLIFLLKRVFWFMYLKLSQYMWAASPVLNHIKAIILISADTGSSANPKKWRIFGPKFSERRCCKDREVPKSTIKKNISVIRWSHWTP